MTTEYVIDLDNAETYDPVSALPDTVVAHYSDVPLKVVRAFTMAGVSIGDTLRLAPDTTEWTVYCFAESPYSEGKIRVIASMKSDPETLTYFADLDSVHNYVT